MSVEYRHDGRKAARILLGGLGLVALSIGLTILGLIESGPDRFILLTVGVAGLLLFGTAASILAWRIVRPTAVATVTPLGIELPRIGLLRWQEISEFRIDQARGQRFLGIVPRDVDALLERLPLAKRALARLNIATGFAPISIPENALPVTLEELMATIEQHHREDRS